MKTYFKLLVQAFKSIFNNKGRSFLTMLGIAIAVFVVVAVDSISNGLAQSTASRFSNLDANRITITSQSVTEATEEDPVNGDSGQGDALRQAAGGGQQVESGNESLTADDLSDILDIANITSASPLITVQTQIDLLDETVARVTVNGVGQDYGSIESFSYLSGSFFSDSQQYESEKVLVIDYAFADGLFETAQSAINQTVVLDDTSYKVIGVLAQPDETDTGFGGSGGRGGGTRVSAYAPYTTVLEITETEKIASIVAETDSEDNVETAATLILASIYENHGVTDETSDIAISTSADALEAISGITAAQSKSDKFIGWIVLLVGGIGIMNIMLVTVSERTREIGLRKAVGAKNGHIVMQFLTESILLTAIGGSIGLITAIGLSGKVTDIFEIQSGGPGRAVTATTAIVDANTIIIALSVSVLAGIIFGLYPAIKASRKDPVESLRYE